ncbi:putative killer cell immunoglobulin-like receptor-like protein KIR3DX1 isoform X1 [Piliocolobus tephrosceles]|uniref:putative killer cell immunoglobulin-like receptor-like protein KIR3DX1 isoform X1 n=1 Tax=Piliocolobus tephrosceles TaxID=591936 RepID=UPI000E6B4D71|nr:putative killer cell immunoglobulin-like receptor-like protein KIR3DX1 isoform X1 [Piliocolobus tephrosceles]XP_026308303.1 putative killer cell immunoglobulin-like receptor-like protein KIR3DX1 isoform X1 [Piliocolobus tephrosceles]
MAPKLITLLCLGFCLNQKICTHVGAQDELSLSAWPSPLVPLGGRVTLSCHSRLQFVMFTIFQTSGSQIRESYTGLSNHVTINAVTPGHAGTYKCAGIYKHTSKQSAGSKSLNIIVTGLFTKPSISAHPSSLVHAGARVRLCCHSELAFDEFILYKEGNTQHSQQYGKMIQAGHHFSKAVFSMGPITPAHAGAYRCCGSFNHSRYMWSAPSDPLDIVITGKYKKPSLITRENAVVGPGDIVTLFCSSRIPFDKYHLSRKQEAHGHWLSGGQSHNGIFQVDLPLCFVSPTSVGSYRCYDAFNESPYEWSAPSDPLHIPVTGISESACPTPMESSPETGSHPQDYTAGNLIRMGVAVLVLVVIGVLLLESCIVRKKKPKRKKKKNTKENHSPFRTIEAWNPIS